MDCTHAFVYEYSKESVFFDWFMQQWKKPTTVGQTESGKRIIRTYNNRKMKRLVFS